MTDQELIDRRTRLEAIGALTVKLDVTTDTAEADSMLQARRLLIDLVLGRDIGQERRAA